MRSSYFPLAIFCSEWLYFVVSLFNLESDSENIARSFVMEIKSYFEVQFAGSWFAVYMGFKQKSPIYSKKKEYNKMLHGILHLYNLTNNLIDNITSVLWFDKWSFKKNNEKYNLSIGFTICRDSSLSFRILLLSFVFIFFPLCLTTQIIRLLSTSHR